MDTPPTHVHDVVAIGLGPFNLGLACLLDPLDDVDAVFLESRPAFDWHPGMLLESATLQTPFLADLVTLADPTSPFSFLQYLKEVGRLYPFYIRESFFPLRTEFNDYCRWAADQLPNVRFGHHVVAVTHGDGVYTVHARRADDDAMVEVRGRRLVLGTGTTPDVPPACRDLGDTAVHTSDYLPHRDRLRAAGTITVVGSGQSAAEVYHDLLGDIDRHGYTLTWVTRSPRFFPLEYTKLTLEMTSPDWVDHFHGLPAATRDGLVDAQRGLYKGIDASLIDAIFDLLYARSQHGPVPTRLLTSTEVVAAEHDPDRGVHRLGLRHRETGEQRRLETQALVLGTGYRTRVPDFLDPVRDRIAWDDRGRFAVRRDFSVDRAGTGEILVQNAELHTHGFVAPDLGMGAHRNSWIIRTLTGREPYPIERRIAFQDFGLPPTLDPAARPAEVVAR